MSGLSPGVLAALAVIGLVGGVGISAVGPGGVLPTIGLFALTPLSPAAVAGTAIATNIGAGVAGTVAFAASGQLRDPATRRTAVLLAVAAVVGLRTPMPDTSRLDRTPSAHWPAPELILSPDPDDGPVLVTLTYRVPEDDAVAFTEAMRRVGRSRRRTGALRWELFRDGSDPTRLVESYLVGTWAEHRRQHEDRLTGADRRFEEEAFRYVVGTPGVAHLFPPPAAAPTER